MFIKPYALKTDVLAWSVLTALALLWDFFGQDLAVSQLFGTAQGFALQNDRLLDFWLHDQVKKVLQLGLLFLLAMVFIPVGYFKDMRKADRVHLLVSVILAALAVSVLKFFNKTSCPWSLAEFGGPGHYVSHWVLGINDGGGGRCFPAGHASSGFAYMAAAFWLRSVHLSTANFVFWIAGAVGVALGWVQLMRGAHFFSHTLWTWVVCWAVAIAYYYAVQGYRASKS
jgi:membrane-associated PAP2 superfamily phosphatase